MDEKLITFNKIWIKSQNNMGTNKETNEMNGSPCNTCISWVCQSVSCSLQDIMPGV